MSKSFAAKDEKRAKDQFLAAFVDHLGRVSDACTCAGITHTNLNHWKANDATFVERLAEAQLRVYDKIRKLRDDAAVNGDKQMLAKWLDLLPEYERIRERTLHHKVSGTVGLQAINRMTPEERKGIILEAYECIKLDEGEWSIE